MSAAFLAACGGDDDSSTSPASDASGVEAGGTVDGGRAGGDDSTDGGGSTGDDSSDDTSGDSSSSDGASPEDLDLPDRGEVSSNSEPFQQYSAKGKLHLAEFGEEADSSDFGEVQDVVVAYLEAYGAKEWEAACGYLLTETKGQLLELAKQSKQSVNGCGDALALLASSPLAKPPGSDGTPIYAPEGIASLRIKEGGLAGGGAGFALFHASNGEDRWMALKVEDGQWRLLSSSSQPFQ